MEPLARHIVIVGSNGVGKSTLLGRLLDGPLAGRPLAGFYTKKEPPEADGVSRVYLHPAGCAKTFSAGNLIGVCEERHARGIPQAFERAAALLAPPAPDAVTLMDELGVMEREARGFQAAVLRAFDEDALVLAAVRDKPDAFLAAVRAHPRAACFFLTPENRDRLYDEVLQFVLRGR